MFHYKVESTSEEVSISTTISGRPAPVYSSSSSSSKQKFKQKPSSSLIAGRGSMSTTTTSTNSTSRRGFGGGFENEVPTEESQTFSPLVKNSSEFVQQGIYEDDEIDDI
jgi:hypothetical protein